MDSEKNNKDDEEQIEQEIISVYMKNVKKFYNGRKAQWTH